MTIPRRRDNRSDGQDQITYGLHELPPLFFQVKTKYEKITVIIIIIIIIIIIKLTLVQATKFLRGSTLSLTSVLDGEMVNTTPRPLYPPGRHLAPIAQGAGRTPRPVMKGAENLARTGVRSPVRPSRNESLYLLSYPGPQ